MAKAVYGRQAIKDGPRNADLHVRRWRHTFRAVLTTHALLIGQSAYVRLVSRSDPHVSNGSLLPIRLLA
jgi:hypothetical protein